MRVSHWPLSTIVGGQGVSASTPVKSHVVLLQPPGQAISVQWYSVPRQYAAAVGLMQCTSPKVLQGVSMIEHPDTNTTNAIILCMPLR